MKPYRIVTDGKQFKIQEQAGWFRKRWVDWSSTIVFGTAEDAEVQIRRLCQESGWQVVKTFNTRLDNVVWSRPMPPMPPMPAIKRPSPSPTPPQPRDVTGGVCGDRRI